MQPIGSRRAGSTPRRWRPIDELFDAVDARQEGGRTPLSDGQLARALATPAPRDPFDDLPRPAAPRPPVPGACRSFVSGGTVYCCEEGETDCPCVCHDGGRG